jgi:hypothetical protein
LRARARPVQGSRQLQNFTEDNEGNEENKNVILAAARRYLLVGFSFFLITING